MRHRRGPPPTGPVHCRPAMEAALEIRRTPFSHVPVTAGRMRRPKSFDSDSRETWDHDAWVPNGPVPTVRANLLLTATHRVRTTSVTGLVATTSRGLCVPPSRCAGAGMFHVKHRDPRSAGQSGPGAARWRQACRHVKPSEARGRARLRRTRVLRCRHSAVAVDHPHPADMRPICGKRPTIRGWRSEHQLHSVLGVWRRVVRTSGASRPPGGPS